MTVKISKQEFIKRYNNDFIFKSIVNANGYYLVQDNIFKFDLLGNFQQVCKEITLNY